MVPAHKPPAEGHENATNSEKNCLYKKFKRQLQKPRFAIEVAAFIVLTVYTSATLYQSCQIKKSTDAGVATVRAWLAIDEQRFVYIDPSSNKVFAPMFTVKITNLGKTPAKHLEMAVEFAFDDSDKFRQFPRCPTAHNRTVQFIKPGESQEWDEPTNNIERAQFAKIVAGYEHASAYAHACIRYDDVITKTPRLTEFCFRYDGFSYQWCADNRME